MNKRYLQTTQKLLGRIVARVVTLCLVSTLAFVDLSHVPLIGPLFENSTPETARAATGDFSVFRNASDNTSVPNGGGEIEIPWDTPVLESSAIDLLGDNTTIDLVDAGKYLVLYNAWTNFTANATNQRRSFETYLTLNETELAYGRGDGYIRNSGSTDDINAYAAGAAIIDVAAGDDLKINIERDDTSTTGQAEMRTGANGVSVVQLDDGLDYLRLQKLVRSGDISANTSFTDVTWDSADEVDTSSFEFTPTSGDITLKGAVGAYFLVTSNVRLNQDASSANRTNYIGRLTLDGSEIPGTRSSTYLRGNASGNGIYNGTVVYSGIVRKTSSSDQILNVEILRENISTPVATDIVGGETAISIVALPDTADVISLTSDATQLVPNSQAPLNFDEQLATPSIVFSHSTTTNPSQINVDVSGDYLFFSTVFAERSNTANGDRDPYRVDWRLDGSTTVAYGGHGMFLRGEQGTYDSYQAGSSGGVLLPGLTDTQYLELTMYDEVDNADANLDNDMIALQGVELSSLLAEGAAVTVESGQTTSVTPDTTAFNTGIEFTVTEISSSRNITNITLSESGTVDGAVDLENITLYYDLDTTAPYDCVSESFGGGESTFGSVDGDGFSAADGISTFTDSVSISTTQSFCGYVIVDVLASAADGETINVNINSPAADVVVTSGGSVSPSATLLGNSQTTVVDPELTQFGYHWRNDDGSETGATSATGGSENAPLLNAATTTPQRLRLGVYNAGTGTTSQQYRLEYAEKAGTCQLASGWTEVGSGTNPAWRMFDSSNVTDGGHTTNIAVSSGGLTDPVALFTTPNGGVKDTNAETSAIVLGDVEENIIGEANTTTVTNGSAQTISLTNTYTNPIVAVSVRYSRSTGTQRTPRVVAKTGSSFDVLIDNYNSTLTGSTQIDYVVFEAGEWELPQGGGLSVYAGTTSVAAVNTFGQTVPGNPGGTIVTWPTTFDSQPAVFATVSSNNDSQWVFANAYDGTAVANPPTVSGATVFMADNFESDGHGAAETVDLLAFETGFGTNNSVDFVWQQTGSTIVSTPSTVNFTTAYSTPPTVVLAYHPTNGGTDGGFTMVDTDTAITASGVTVSVDEDGAGADRGHTGAETASILSFASAVSLVNAEPTLVQTFVELEYALEATTDALEGVGYCFRVTDAGSELRNYSVYPEATLNADVSVSSLGDQTASLNAGASDVHVGGTFVVTENVSSRTVTDITLSESGTLDAASDITDVRLRYDLDTTAPYDCASESYAGTEPLFGVVGSFSGANGSSTFSSSVAISTTATLCAYATVSIDTGVSNGDSLILSINNPSSEVVTDSGSVGPGSTIGFLSSTTIAAAALTQTGYHWRNDDGTEATANSATGGSENTGSTNVAQGSTIRLRSAVSNEGSASSGSAALRLEYGLKVTTCSAVGSWQRIDDGAAFTMATTSQLVEGANTTDIAIGTGGITNPNTTFLVGNAAQRDTADESSALSLAATEFVELEFAIVLTEQSSFDSTYCFRITDAGTTLAAYDLYPELTTRPQQDFFVQRGAEFIVGTSRTFTAGVDYTAPASGSSAFVRITNSHHTGAGTPAGSNDPPDDTSAYIEVTDLTTSFDIVRPSTAAGNTYVAWEIVEYVGLSGADNEMIVRDTGTITYGATDFFATGTSATVADDSQVVVFVTGQFNPSTDTDSTNLGLTVSSWNATNSVPVFERGDVDSPQLGNIATRASYAVVEFTGVNWVVQRVDHTYAAAGVFETAAINPVTSVTQTFLHTQKLSGDGLFNLDETGHEIYLSGMGTLSLELESGADNPSDQRSVVWVVENTQTGDGALRNWRSDGRIASGGSNDQTFILSIGLPAEEEIVTTNASLFINNQSTGAGEAHPRAFLGATIASSTDYILYKSDEGQNQDYRVEIIEWPVAELSVRQNYYRLYVDNDALTPSDPWPLGVDDLGENTSMTDLDEPLGLAERARVRMSLAVSNASLVAESQSYTLQYGRRVTTCSAVSSWTDVGAPGSGEIWRGYTTSVTDGTPVASTSLLLSVSDEPGSFESANDSALNPTTVDINDDLEYDWIVENNGALQKSSYCFRMVEAGGGVLDGYNFYPTVRTSGYTPIIASWQWFTDIENITPSSPAAGVAFAAPDVDVGDTLKLRVAVAEIEGAAGASVKFNLEYSEYSDFRDGGTLLTATTSCTGGTFWCYADGGGDDNAFVPTSVLSGIDSCVAGVGDGCGVHNEATGLFSSFNHAAGAVAEHEFTLQHDAALTNQVYYFRLVDATNGGALLASSSYPSINTAGSDFSFTIAGLPSGSTTEGVTLDETASSNQVSFSNIPLNTSREVAHELQVSTNAPGGYRVFLFASQDLQNGGGDTIPAVPGTNAVPVSWASSCLVGSSCFGYHVGDDTLSGDGARFLLDDTYAALPVGVYDEVMYNDLPHADAQALVYRIQIDLLQQAGRYSTNLQYIAVPQF